MQSRRFSRGARAGLPLARILGVLMVVVSLTAMSTFSAVAAFGDATRTQQSTLQILDELTDETTDPPVAPPVEEPVVPPVEVPVDVPVEDPVDGPVDVPVEEPVDVPVDEPVDIPVDEPVDVPAPGVDANIVAEPESGPDEGENAEADEVQADVFVPSAAVLTAAICLTLDADDDGVVEPIELTAAAALDLDGDGTVGDVDDIALINLALLGGCDTLIDPVAPGPVLTVSICLTLDANGDGTITADEITAAALIDVDGDGTVGDADDVALVALAAGGGCTGLITPGAPTLTAAICLTLDADDDGVVERAELEAAVGLDLDGDGTVADLDDLALINLAINGGCDTLIDPVAPGPVLTVGICITLDADGDGVVEAAELAAAVTIDLDGDGTAGDLDDLALITLAINGGCDDLLDPPVLTVDICLVIDLNGDDVISGTELAAALLIDLDGDGVVGDDGDLALITLAINGGCAAPGVTPVPPTSGEPGSAVVSKFECTQIEEPTATISDPIGVSGGVDDDELDEQGCAPSVASFEIYLNNDFSSEPFASFDAGVETINGIPMNAGGVPHLLLEVDTNVFFNFFVESGGVTTLTILNPADDGDATPVGDDDDDGDSSDDGDGDGNGSGNNGGNGSNGGNGGGGAVTSLPSTGQGSDGVASGSAIVLLFSAMSLVALAAGFAWRQRRTI